MRKTRKSSSAVPPAPDTCVGNRSHVAAGQTPFGRRARAKSEDTVAEDLAQLSGHRSRLSVSHVTAGHTDHGKGRFTGKMIDVDIDT